MPVSPGPLILLGAEEDPEPDLVLVALPAETAVAAEADAVVAAGGHLERAGLAAGLAGAQLAARHRALAVLAAPWARLLGREKGSMIKPLPFQEGHPHIT